MLLLLPEKFDLLLNYPNYQVFTKPLGLLCSFDKWCFNLEKDDKRGETVQRNFEESVCLVPAPPDKAVLKSVDEGKVNGAEGER